MAWNTDRGNSRSSRMNSTTRLASSAPRYVRRYVSWAPAERSTVTQAGEDGDPLPQASPPALTRMDIQQPGMSGIDALRVLRADERTRGIPVIAVTASAMTQDRQKIMSAGFDGYQAKPIDVNQFVAAVRAMLARPSAGGPA